MLNIIGYYGVFVGLEYRSDAKMATALDAEQYDDSQAITIVIPVSVPYMADDADFKRVDGKFEYNGEHYRLVKQKYAKDTLTVVCVPDPESKRITQALSDYLKTFTDQPTSQNQASKISLNLSKDYISQVVALTVLSAGFETDTSNFGRCIELIPSFSASYTHPPERA